MLQKLKKIINLLICILMLWWVASLIHAEYLTNMYGNEFYQTVNKECGIENGGYYKVLDYKHLKYGRLYCVIKNQYANYACELIITGSGQNQKIVLMIQFGLTPVVPLR